MNRYAIIENNQVVNIIEYKDAPSNPPPGFPDGVIAVQSDFAEIGNQYQDGIFTSLTSIKTPIMNVQELRRMAYISESDPLFFKWQAGEATQSEWQLKRDEIRERFPKL